MTITLQYASTPGISSWAIRAFSHGWVTHVDVVMPDGRLLGARYSTPGVDRRGFPLKGGVAIRKPMYEHFTRTMQLVIPCSAAQDKRFYDFLRAQVGKPYDTTSIYAFAVNRDWRKDDSWMCSELTITAEEEAPIFPRLTTASNRVTPEMSLFVNSAFTSTHWWS